MNDDCGCSEDYGPCEDHAETLAQREGASTRTADALALVFLMDVRDLIDHALETNVLASDLTDARDRLTREIDDALTWEWSGADAGDGWLETPADDSYSPAEYLQDLVQRAESDLGMIGASVYWDDGYVISRMHDDCPLIAGYGADDDETSAEHAEAEQAYEDAASEYRP